MKIQPVLRGQRDAPLIDANVFDRGLQILRISIINRQIKPIKVRRAVNDPQDVDRI